LGRGQNEKFLGRQRGRGVCTKLREREKKKKRMQMHTFQTIQGGGLVYEHSDGRNAETVIGIAEKCG